MGKSMRKALSLPGEKSEMTLKDIPEPEDDGIELPFKEEWRVLPLDPTVQISSLGRVKRGRRISKLKPNAAGYVPIRIKGNTYQLHRIVAELFIPNPDNLEYIDHIDNNHSNNAVSNLRWVTAQQNAQYAAEMGLMTRKKNDKSVVIVYDSDFNGKVFKTMAEAGRYYNVNSATFFDILAGSRKSHKGLKVIKFKELEYVETNNNSTQQIPSSQENGS